MTSSPMLSLAALVVAKQMVSGAAETLDYSTRFDNMIDALDYCFTFVHSFV